MLGIKPMSVRENTQADFDLERMFGMLDEALTSKDERVQDALRGLLTIIALTRTQDDGKNLVETSHGPLRQMQEDLKHISRRLNTLEGEVRQRGTYVPPANPYIPNQPYNPGPGGPVGPYVNPGSPYSPPDPKTGTPWWGPDPNMPYTTSKTSSSSSYTLTDNKKNSTMGTTTIKLTK